MNAMRPVASTARFMSAGLVLISAPRFCGGDHFSQLSSRRRDSQMSFSPSPPARPLEK